MPVRGATREVFARGDAVIVLTPTEVRVACGLATGRTLENLAVSANISTHTSRSHLRGVLDKTGCGWQAEAVALLAGLSLGRDPAPPG